MIGLPLRLLAREVYQRVVDKAGEHNVALVTGEEKIKPDKPRYWISTVEAMPRDLDLAFVAVDEIQLAADLDRGHVFTDRLLNQRGREETLLIGSATMRPLIEALVPGVHVITPAAAVEALLRRREEDLAPAAPLRHRRLLGRGGLRHRRADPAPARRRRGRARRALAAHPQRPGRAVPERRRRLPRRHRRDRHGAQPRRRPRRLRLRQEIRRLPLPQAPSGRARPDRRPRRALHARRHLRHRRGAARPSIPMSSRRSRTTPSIRCASCNGATRTSTSRRSRSCSESLADQPREHGLIRAPFGEDVARARARRARGRYPRLRALARRRAAPLGGVPGAGLPQGLAGRPMPISSARSTAS